MEAHKSELRAGYASLASNLIDNTCRSNYLRINVKEIPAGPDWPASINDCVVEKNKTLFF
jgi:hypothetical protein